MELERLGIEGMITLHEIPDWTDEEFRRYWPRMSEEERERRVILQTKNLITNAGIANILNNLSTAGLGQQQPLTQILSVGNGAISGVTRADTSVAGDGFGTNARKAPTTFAIVGFTTTITTNYASGDANGTWTNAGFYGFKVSGGQSATTTSGTGALMTHVLFNFVKGASAIAVAYSFSLSN